MPAKSFNHSQPESPALNDFNVPVLQRADNLDPNQDPGIAAQQLAADQSVWNKVQDAKAAYQRIRSIETDPVFPPVGK